MDNGKEKICKEISVYLDRIEELENGTAEAVLLIDEGEEEYSGEFHLPENFLPEKIEEGDYLTMKVFCDTDKTDSALDEDSKKLIACFKKIEKLEDGMADAVLMLENGEKEFMTEFNLPENFLPEDAKEGDYLTIKILRDTDKTNAALDEARQLLKELE